MVKVLNVELVRVNNSIVGCPRFKLVRHDNTTLLNSLIDSKYFKVLKGGIYTKVNSSINYNISNKFSFKINDITIKGVTLARYSK